MAIWLSLRSYKRGSTELVIFNGTTNTGYIAESGGDWGTIENTAIYSGSIDTEGSSKVREKLENRTITLPILVNGEDTAATVATYWESLETKIQEIREYKGEIRFRPSNSSYAVTFQVEHLTLQQLWGKTQELGGWRRTSITAVCKPYALMDSMDIIDAFDASTITTAGKYNNGGADWTADAGALTNCTVTNGILDASANLSTENRFIHTGTSYTYNESAMIVECQPGATTTNFKCGAILKRVDASNYVEAYVDDDGANSRVRIDTIVAGVRTNQSTVSLGSLITAGKRLWLDARLNSNSVYVQLWLEDIHGTSEQLVGSSGYTPAVYTMTGTEKTTFGTTVEGRCGIVFTPQHTDAGVYRVQIRPFSISERLYANLPDTQIIGVNVPGTAPALADVGIVCNSSATQCLIGWDDIKNPINRCWNGSFQQDTGTAYGWSVAAVAGVSGAATSIAIGGVPDVLDGNLSGVLTCPATSGTGASFLMARSFKKGVTYTATAYIRAGASTTGMILKLGRSGDISSSSVVALSTSWQAITVDWTPTADSRTPAYVALVTNTATATVCNIDRVTVVEKNETLIAQETRDGMDKYPGGFDTCEYIDSMNTYVSTGSVTATVLAGALGGYYQLIGSTGTVLNLPIALQPDTTITGETVYIKVFARMYLASGLTTCTMPISHDAAQPGTYAYSIDYGSTGKNIIASKPSAGSKLVNVFLGTFAIPIGDISIHRFNMRILFTYTGTAPGIDSIFMVRADKYASTISALSGAASSLASFQISSSITYYMSDGSCERERYNYLHAGTRARVKTGGMIGNKMVFPAGRKQKVMIVPMMTSIDHATPADDDAQSGSYTHVSVRPRRYMVGS